MATAAATRIDAEYRRRLEQLRSSVLRQLEAEYGRAIDPDAIVASFKSWAPDAVRRLAAAQGSAQTLAAAYVRSFVQAHGVDEELAPITNRSGRNRDGNPLSDAFAAIGPSIVAAIGNGRTLDDALEKGRFLLERTADSEVTAAADSTVQEQMDQLTAITGWEGIVNANACDDCVQANSGIHALEDELYRHGNCGCSSRPVVGN